MSLRWALIGGSLLAHGGLVWALGGIRKPASLTATAIEVTETKKLEPPPPANIETPPPPPPQNERPQPRARTAKAAEAAPELTPTTPQSPSLADLPDFGLELSGGSGPGGLAVAPPANTAPAPRVTKSLQKAPAPLQKAVDTCDEGPAKPKLINLPQPAYTEAARAAGLEGKVRVQLTVDESGKVIDVQKLSSLGEGLDEAAIAAAKAATFEPAIRCGRPSRSTFTLSIRFSAS